MRRKRLLLINPSNRGGGPGTIKDAAVRVGIYHAPMGLAMVAGATPPDWRVEILDENYEVFSFRDADVVGITAYTNTAPRAYEIARVYRSRGIPVILGGVHASMLPDEAQQYADSVVTGEAEEIWPSVLADGESGRLEPLYRSSLVDVDKLPRPRWDLLNLPKTLAPIQTARGCPMDCEFCSVTTFNGHKYRQRSVDKVLDEVAAVPSHKFFFVDDNFIGSTRRSASRARAIFQGMIDRKLEKTWICQASMNFGEDESLLKLAAAAGCRSVLIGIEAENSEALAAVNKRMNLRVGIDNFETLFRRINKYGINVIGAFLFGTDADTAETMKRRARYIAKSSVNIAQVTCLTPLPGTRLMKKLEEEGRLLDQSSPESWRHHDFTRLVFSPQNMTPEEFERVFTECTRTVYGPATIARRTLRTLRATRSPQRAWRALIGNTAFHIAYRGIYGNK